MHIPNNSMRNGYIFAVQTAPSGTTQPLHPMKAIKILNQLILDQMKEKYPDIRVELLPNKPLKCNSANSLTQAVKKFLTLNGHQCDRISTSGRVIDNSKEVSNVLGQRYRIGSSKYIPGTGTKGKADLAAKIRRHPTDEFAVPVDIEIKYNKDRQSSVQKTYAENVHRAGGIYIICRSLDEFIEWYNEFTA